MNTLLSLNIEGRDLVPPQIDVSDIFTSPWEVLPSLQSGWRVGSGEGEGVRGGEGG